MGVYYKLVNRVTRQRIEPELLGSGGIKHSSIVFGPAGRIFAWLHMKGKADWRVIDDCGEEYFLTETKYADIEPFTDVTEEMRLAFNSYYPSDPIAKNEDHED